RRTPVVSSMRRTVHPSRPSANTCCRFSSFKTLAIPAENHTGSPTVNVPSVSPPYGRFSGVHIWPVLGVHRGFCTHGSLRGDRRSDPRRLERPAALSIRRCVLGKTTKEIVKSRIRHEIRAGCLEPFEHSPCCLDSLERAGAIERKS